MSSLNLEQVLGWVNALDYGVKGDGAADDAPALNSLLSTAGAGTVVVLPGINPNTGQGATYFLRSNVGVPTNTLVVLSAGLTLTGSGTLFGAGGAILDLRSGTITVNGPFSALGLVFLGRQTLQMPVLGSTLTTLPAGNQTLTAARLLGGFIEHPITANTTDTTDTGANLDAAVPGVQVGDSFECVLTNTASGAYSITLAAGTGVTLKGSTTTIGQNKSAYLVFRRTGPAAWTCYVSVSA